MRLPPARCDLCAAQLLCRAQCPLCSSLFMFVRSSSISRAQRSKRSSRRKIGRSTGIKQQNTAMYQTETKTGETIRWREKKRERERVEMEQEQSR